MPKKKADYKKIVLFWIIVFLVGGLSGVFFNRVFLPWLADLPLLNKISWLNNVKNGTTIINKTDRVFITQETAYQDAINKIGGSVVAVRVERAGRTPIENSGFILTGDGLIVTANFVLASNAKILVIRGDREYEAQLVKQDAINHMALLKINENNLSVVDFAEGNGQLGQRVFLLGASKIGDQFAKFANFGFIKAVSPVLSFNFTDSPLADGAPLGNIEGKVLGLCLTDRQGNITVVGVEKIRGLMQ